MEFDRYDCAARYFDIQEEQRRAWHNAIPLADGAWDIGIIDDAALLRTYDRVFRSMRYLDLRDDHQVKFFVFSNSELY